MSDQCRHCKAVGKWEECQATECFQHENWHAEQSRERIAILTERCKVLEKWAGAHGLVILDKNDFWKELK
jgi:hypothetical protein